jgi:eukaryotic-like serine/threonine-protein kinase
MSSSTDDRLLSLDSTQPTWDLLAARVDALITAWESGAPPELGSFLPDAAPSVRRLILIELIKADLEQRVSRQQPLKLIEDFAAEFPELSQGGVPCDLLYEEFHLRKRLGEAVELSEYRRRFPQQAQELARLLGAQSTFASTAAHAVQTPGSVKAGDRLDDFDLLALIGQGAFAQVFLARQQSLQRLVALKVSADRGAEPQTLAQLDHPHIVRVYDQRVIRERGLRLLYMPYLAGGTLSSVLEYARAVPQSEWSGQTFSQAIDRALNQRAELPSDTPLRRSLARRSWWQVVCWVGARMADALHYAHERGVLHRDVKPANVLLAADGSPRLADFNVGYCSKLEGASAAAFFGGSLVYMSPEQLEAFNPAHDRKADSLDGRCDIYSLGLTLWELLTGRRPFGGETAQASRALTLTEMTRRRNAGLPADVATQLPRDCPPALERILRKCLAPNPDDRFATAGELARALDLCLQPRAQALLEPSGGWRGFARRHPLLCILPAGLIPNVAAGLFNYLYNRSEIIAVSEIHETLRPAFERIQTTINLISFPLGILVFIWIARPVVRGLRRLCGGEKMSDAELATIRARTLRLGWYGSLVSLGGWLLASIVYPIALRLAVPELAGASFQKVFGHFLASLAICGLIAAAYPFFTATSVAIRALYPAFLRPGTATARDWDELVRLDWLVWPFLALTAAVPLAGVALLVGFNSLNQTALVALSVVGLLGLGVAVWLARRIQRDLADLGGVVRPSEVGPLSGDSDSRLSASWGG